LSCDAPTPADSSRYRWLVVGVLWFICFFNYADRQALSAVFPLLKSRFGFNMEQLGLIGAAFTWVYSLAAPFAGQSADRWSRKVLILGGLMVWSTVTGFTAICAHVWQFVVVRGAEGLGETFYFPASMSMIGAYHDGGTRSRAMSLHQTSVYAGTIGGSAFAGWLAMRYGWQAPFLVLGAAGCLLAVALARVLREPPRPRGRVASAPRERRVAENSSNHQSDRRDQTGLPDPADVRRPSDARQSDSGNSEPAIGRSARLPIGEFLRELIRTPAALLLVLAFFGANFVALVFLTWMPTFLKEKFGLNLAAAGMEATLFIQVASMAGAIAGGALADRWQSQIAGGRMLAQAVGALAGGPFIFLCGFTRDRMVLIVAMTLFGLAKGLYDANIWAALYDVVAPSRRATAVGLMNMVGWLGGGLGAYLVGAAVTRWHFTMSRAIETTAVIYTGVAIALLIAAVCCAPADVCHAGAGEA